MGVKKRMIRQTEKEKENRVQFYIVRTTFESAAAENIVTFNTQEEVIDYIQEGNEDNIEGIYLVEIKQEFKLDVQKIVKLLPI